MYDNHVDNNKDRTTDVSALFCYRKKNESEVKKKDDPVTPLPFLKLNFLQKHA